MSRLTVLTAMLLAVAAAAALAAPAPAAAQEGTLRAGAGRADITPPTGYPLLGWARGDARAKGVHTRLYARALLLQREGRRLALVSVDLNMVPGGLVQHAAQRAGFDVDEVIVSASHTHGGPTGYSNFLFKDAAAPTSDAPESGVDEPDPLLYTFLVDRIATALRRARADLAPAVAGWATTRLTGVTANRSIEAHLADHGIELPRGAGSPEQDPEGAIHTVNPDVDVLRVDHVRGGRRIPLGAWSTFANHGTVNPASFDVYNADHHAAAAIRFEEAVRREARLPRRREVVNVYGNSDAGDVSSGLGERGPEHAERVGHLEASAMLRAWRAAGRVMDDTPPLVVRWTRVCFCGQQTAFGPLADRAVFGVPFATGSEEGRGPLFDVTGEVLEGRRHPAPQGVHGVKIHARVDEDRTLVPSAVPLTAAWVGNRVIVTVPGEMTAEMGRRTRDAVRLAIAGSGAGRVVLSGYANEYASYFTTPEEYTAQHYEGATTLYGPASGPFLSASLADLARRAVQGEPAPEPVEFDPVNGLEPVDRSYPPGARRGRARNRPDAVRRGGTALFWWAGGAAGLDRPLDDPFVRVQRRVRRGWRTVATDLGLGIVWHVHDARRKDEGIPRFRRGERGAYRAEWSVPDDAPRGRYRFVVTAERYTVRSGPFRVR